MGVWRTVGGRRIFIKDGQDLETAMAESGKFNNIINKNKLKNELKEALEYKPIYNSIKNISKKYNYISIGNMVMDKDKISSAKEHEELITKRVHDLFGGNLHLLKDSYTDNQKNPDLLWNGKLWEIKKCSSISSIDNQLRKATKQIASNTGGVIIDLNSNISNNKNIMKYVEKSALFRYKNPYDLIVFENTSKIKAILRIEK